MEKKDPKHPHSLLAAAPRVVNVGLEMFAVNLADHGAEGLDETGGSDGTHLGAYYTSLRYSPR